jgi:UDP-N-acetylglucosamine 2-epimerase
MRILIVFGTRPEVIKLAPVVYALRDRFDVKILHTGQHQEMADETVKFFKLKPDANAAILDGPKKAMSAYSRLVGKLAVLLPKMKPDAVIVQGDTMTAYVTAFCAFIHKIPVLHLEAGLRTFDKFSPFPEEMNRCLVSRLAEFHFAPTKLSADNLLREGVPQDRIVISGNSIVDAVELGMKLMDKKAALRDLNKASPELHKALLAGGPLTLITSHRRENIGAPLRRICKAALTLAKRYPEHTFLWPQHRNPAVRADIRAGLGAVRPQNLIMTEGLDYQSMLYVLGRVSVILTDSGGLQEEALAVNRPVIILRETTERPEVVESGLGILAGTDIARITGAYDGLARDGTRSGHIKNTVGDGKTSLRVAQLLALPEVRKFVADYPASSTGKLNVKNKLKAGDFR